MNRILVIKPLSPIVLLMMGLLCWSPQLFAQKGGLKSGRSGKSSTKSSYSSPKSSSSSSSTGSSSSGSSSGSSWNSGSSSSWSAPSASSASSASSDDDYSTQSSSSSYSSGSSYSPSRKPSSTSTSTPSTSKPEIIYISASSDDEPTRYIPKPREIKVKRRPKPTPKPTTTTSTPSIITPSTPSSTPSKGNTTPTTVRSGTGVTTSPSSGATTTLLPSESVAPVKKPLNPENPEPNHPVVFTSSVLEVLPRPTFTKPNTWVFEELSSLEVRPLDPLQPDPPGLPICPLDPAPPEDLSIQADNMTQEAISCADNALFRLQELYMLGNWCDPGFLNCFETYLNSLSHCTECLPIGAGQFTYLERLRFYQDELNFWRASCGQVTAGADLRIFRCYLKRKAMMISGLAPEVQRNFEPDRMYLDTAFGLPDGGQNYYNFVVDFNPQEVRLKMIAFVNEFPVVQSWQTYQDLDRFFQTFSLTGFTEALQEKLHRNIDDSRASQSYDRGYAYQVAENCAWISHALRMLEPTNLDFEKLVELSMGEARKYQRDYERSDLSEL